MVRVQTETWLEEKQEEIFWGWAYAMDFLSKIGNKKVARACERPNGCYTWISRHKEFRYEFDGMTIKEEIDLPRRVQDYEDEEYMGELPPENPKSAF